MKKKKKSFPKKPALVLTAAALLLVGSTVGSTRAALTYYSENYSAQMNMQSIGVSLLENDKVVSSRDYVSNNEWKGPTLWRAPATGMKDPNPDPMSDPRSSSSPDTNPSSYTSSQSHNSSSR